MTSSSEPLRWRPISVSTSSRFAIGRLVEHDRVLRAVLAQPRDRQLARRLGRTRVRDHHRRGAHRQLAVHLAEPSELRGARRLGRAPRHRITLPDRREHPTQLCGVGEHLARADAHELVEHARQLQLGREQLTGGGVEVSEADLRAALGRGWYQCGQVARQLGIEHLVIEHDPRRDDAHDLALDQPLRELRILDLLAHDDLVTELGQLGEVTARRVMGHAAHRYGVVLALVARGQREIEQSRREHRVLEEQLIEVAEPKEHERIGVPVLDVQVLAHQRRLGGTTAHATALPRRSDIVAKHPKGPPQHPTPRGGWGRS
jgi:hypothetical protein